MNDESTTKPDYSVEVEIHDSAYFKVVWAHGLRYRPYLIDRGDVQAVSGQIRDQLSALVGNALRREREIALHNDNAVEAANKDEHEIMETLIERCAELFEVLFRCAPGSSATQAYVHEHIRDKIRGERSGKSICFLVKPRVYVPWGLLYDGTLAPDADPTNPDDYAGFWCLKHQISTVFDALASPSDFVVTYDNGVFQTLSIGDAAEFTKAELVLKECLEEQGAIDMLRKRHGSPATTSETLIKAWTDCERTLGLLYFFGHADAKNIGFSATDTISVVKFKNVLIKSGTSPRCLVFLNGCYTTNPDENGTFLEATGRDGFCGYIGAETEVPATFAFRFGLAFQCLLYRGLEVVEIMSQLRRKHWPLSLVYGLYGFPHVSVTHHPEIGKVALPEANYSTGPLGERIV